MTSSTAIAAIPRMFSGTRIDPRNSTRFIVAVLVLVAVVGVAGTVGSFNGIMEAASWSPLRDVAIVVPIVIDVSPVVFTLAVVLLLSRGEQYLGVAALVFFYAAVSVVLNVMPSLVGFLDPATAKLVKTITGAVIAGLMPVSILMVTFVLIRIAVQKPERSPEELQALEREKRHKHLDQVARRAAQVEEAQLLDAERKAIEQQKAANRAEFDRTKNLPEAKRRGTPERALFKKMCVDTYNDAENPSVEETAKRLGVDYHRVRSVIDEWKDGTESWDPRK